MIVILFVVFLKRWGYQCCVGHLGIATIAFVLSLYIFAVTFPSKVKRGKYSKIQCSIWLKKCQLLGLWGLVSKIYTYEFGNLCGRQKGLMLVFQTYLKFFETDECSIFNSLNEVSTKTVCLCILCSRNVCS